MEDALYDVFIDFCCFGKGQGGSRELDSAKFVKLARDTNLICRKLSTTDLDLIFTRVKGKGEKRIDFGGFCAALQQIASHTGMSFSDVKNAVVKAGGPTIAGTLPDDVRFHDDKSTYTGVHSKGGPTHVDRHHVTMEYQLDRSAADSRGVKAYEHSPEGIRDAMGKDRLERRRQSQEDKISGGMSGLSLGSSKNAQSPGSRRASAATSSSARRRSSAATHLSDDQLEERVADVFVAFASSVAKTTTEIDSARFFKLCQDCGLVGRSLSRTDCDLVFTKACAESGSVKRITYRVFRNYAVPMVADRMNTTIHDVMQTVADARGVTMSGTFADPNRFHDDRGTYTGVHTSGGPSHTDRRISLENLTDRAPANVRGVPKSLAMDSAGSRRGSAAKSPVTYGGDSRRSSNASTVTGGSRRSSAVSGGPTIAGSANRAGGVYDRLSNPSTYTGVYAERFNGGSMGGRINGDTVNYSGASSSFKGSTNSGGDYIVRDISQICNRK